MIVQDDISVHLHQKKKSDVSMNLDICPFCVSEVFRVMSTRYFAIFKKLFIHSSPVEH